MLLPEIRKTIDNILARINEKVESYSSDILWQNAVNNFPLYGQFIDMIIRDWGSKVAAQRLSQTIELIRDEVNLVDSTHVDWNYIASDEFYDLLLNLLTRSVRDRITEKKKIFAKILAGSVIIETKEYRGTSEDLLILLEDLSFNDLILLKNVINQQKNMKKVYEPYENIYNELKTVDYAGWDKLREACGLDEEHFQISLLKLSRSGFIREITGSYLGYMGGTFIITPISINLIRLVNEL